MRRLLLCLLLCLPIGMLAQNNTWEVPEQNEPAQEQKAKPKKEKAPKEQKYSPRTDPKYLAGAVPVVDGDVVFTLDKDVPGMTAAEIYDKVYAAMQSFVDDSKDDGLQPASRIAAVNKEQHTIAARMKEWLVFHKNAISIDRTVMNYTLIAVATDGHLHMTMERISYEYEMDKRDTGFKASAEEWITDKVALNKKRTKTSAISGKFRIKTIDRKDNIFMRTCKALGIGQ